MAELSASLRGVAAPSWHRCQGRACAFARCLLFVLFLLPAGLTHAVEAIPVDPDQPKTDITAKVELYEGRGDRLQIETAPGPDGYIGRMAVQATVAGTNPGWLVFALSNPTGERIVRWLVAPRYTLVNSRVFWPELDAARIAAVTPSLGFRPEPLKSARDDMFRLNLEPGQTITFAAELSSPQVPRLTLWDANAYQAKQQDRMLFNGVLLGITGLLAPTTAPSFLRRHSLPGWSWPISVWISASGTSSFLSAPTAPPSTAPRPKLELPRAWCCSSTPSCASDFGTSGSGACSGAGSLRNSA
jgi:hypothetical protein